jgi:hypothetical protein
MGQERIQVVGVSVLALTFWNAERVEGRGLRTASRAT